MFNEVAESLDPLGAKDPEPFLQGAKISRQQASGFFWGVACGNSQDGGETLVDTTIERPLAPSIEGFALLSSQDKRFHGGQLLSLDLPAFPRWLILSVGSPSATVYLGQEDLEETVRVHLPDGDIYDLPESLLIRNGELANVSLQP